ncbi:XdhC family protein [Eilatimonas milleporae]|uniref:Xanthine dehydrogenase accessory factor n=1 Tax=Eilatimonas milleporae TaxID=911205 RepID=A0A3M0C4Y9_9PROT|nr:XdhC family protein [Eilatimonas milleporae]RMB04911.1 xanthine dehydrogenase accessory factor [Eilatimonas milleporae]
MKEEIDKLLDWKAEGMGCALCLVMKTWGSAPRQAGSLLVVRQDGAMTGSVSGGCVEGEVIAESLALIDHGGMKQLEYGVTDETAIGAGLACGGQISLLLMDVTSERLAVLAHAADALNRRGVLDIHIDIGTGIFGMHVPDRAGIQHDQPGLSDNLFVLRVRPRPRLVLIGAVHISSLLGAMASAAGHDVEIIDPRSAFTEARPFEAARMIEDWPDDALAANPPDAHTAVAALTHDPKLDDAALSAALDSPAYYIGALGSRKSHAKRCERLTALGFDTNALDRIFGPIGLPIGARTPAEIALSILSQITAIRRGASL